MKIKIIVLILGSLILLAGLVYAQGLISFPTNFEITLPQLPARQSQTQILFNCPYDSNVQYRMVGIRDLQWNGTVPTVTADVMYWTNNKKCAGSKKFVLTLPITLSQSALVNNFQNQINAEFIQEAMSNRQPRNEGYIAGSLGASSSGASI